MDYNPYDEFDDDEEDYDDYPIAGDGMPYPPMIYGNKKGKKGAAATSKGLGYGGNGNDKRTRKAGMNQAKKREAKTLKDWQAELKAFLKNKKQSDDDVTPEFLNTLKQSMRCQAPDWWWKQPQRNLYISALQVCNVLTLQYPKKWGDPEDEESAMAALEQLAETSKLLVKQLGNDDNQKEAEVDDTSDASTWLSEQLKAPSKNTHDKDASLPMGVLKIRAEAAKAVKKVLETPECSMMGSHDYYRQKLRPLAFGTVEAFNNPKHFFAPGGGHERGPRYPQFPSSYYSKQNKKKATPAKKSDNGIKPSARVLWKELSSYPTALPIEYGSSIFVRAVENEMDKLRVLIIGPDDSPYANGCFLFDVTLGDDYPNKPPKVQFLTTSSFLSATDKNIRFNPNLYECGKVCLSLLGTWSGPSWTPGESTLLQVLISLQSLILVADPYFNEPGYQSSEGTALGKRESEKYNQNIRRQTLQVAILPFLQNQLSNIPNSGRSKRKNPPGQNGTNNNSCHFAEFKDVIEQHFKLKLGAIRKQLFSWLEKDKSLQGFYNEFWNVSDTLDKQSRAATAAMTSGRQQRKRAKVDAPPVKMKDGVILLDDDDGNDDALQRALANSIAETKQGGARKKPPKEDGNGVILLDSDDEDSKKPAAKTSACSNGEGTKTDQKLLKQAPNVAAAVASPPKGSDSGNDDVVDLT